jgi:hypothetical protein
MPLQHADKISVEVDQRSTVPSLRSSRFDGFNPVAPTDKASHPPATKRKVDNSA